MICISDSKLSLSAWAQVEQAFGGVTGHTFDLMALDSNAVIGRDGIQLPHFSPSLRCKPVLSRLGGEEKHV